MLRSDKVYECVREYTEKLLATYSFDSEGADAEYVSSKTDIERSNVSRELNQLWKNGKLIKFQGRPVFFMDYVTIKKAFPSQYIPLLIPYGNRLSSYLNEDKEVLSVEKKYDPLDRIIGSQNGSMVPIVDDVLSAISYKTHLLPVLLKGEKGLRRRSFVNAIFDHAKLKGIKSEDSRLIIINCLEYQDAGDRFLMRIFGYEEEKGAFELANKGIIFLQNIHCLHFNQLTPITDALTFGYYSKVNEIRRRKLEVSVIASINENASKDQLEFYNGIFPVIVELPSFNNRNVYEKIEMILSIFTDEAVSLNTSIVLNKSIISIFLQYHYEENERQLVNYIRITCANALRHQNSELEKALYISINHLPLDLISSTGDFGNDPFYISALNLFEKDYLLCESNGHCESFEFFRSIQDKYNEKNLIDFSRQLYLNDERLADVDHYIDESIETVLHCDEAHYHKLRSFVANPVRLIFLKEIFSNPYYSRISENNRILYAMMVTVSSYLENRPALSFTDHEDEDRIEYESAVRICQQLDIADPAVTFYICRYLKKATSYFDHHKAGILIVSRGESIATQYRDLCSGYAEANRIRVEAVDYHDFLQYNDLLELIFNKVSAIENDLGTIIITDSLPIKDIENLVKEKTGHKCKVISPLSYEMMISCIDQLNRSVSIDNIGLNVRIIADHDQRDESEEGFIRRFTDDVLSRTLTHVNPEKAVNVLLLSLDEILNELKIIKSRDIVVKYLSHGVHMLERIIKRQPLNYYQLNKFTAENHNLMDIIAKSLSAAENTFDLSVPSCEIAYLAEIFLEGIE